MKDISPNIRADLIRLNINTLADVIREATISEQANKVQNSQFDNILSEERSVKPIQTAMSINHIQTANQQQPSNYHKVSTQTYSNYRSDYIKNGTQTFSKYKQASQKHMHAKSYNKQQPTSMGPKVNPNYICIRCDRQGHYHQNRCPFIDTVCYACSKIGHIQRACKSSEQ